MSGCCGEPSAAGRSRRDRRQSFPSPRAIALCPQIIGGPDRVPALGGLSSLDALGVVRNLPTMSQPPHVIHG
jgi:hypothetical protein